MIEFEDLDMEDQVNMPQYKRRTRDVRAENIVKQGRPKDVSLGFNVSQGVFKKKSATIRSNKREK